MLQVDKLTARIVQVGSLQPFWAASILDEGINAFHRLDEGGPWHEEPTREAAKEWAKSYIQSQTGKDTSGLDWTEF